MMLSEVTFSLEIVGLLVLGFIVVGSYCIHLARDNRDARAATSEAIRRLTTCEKKKARLQAKLFDVSLRMAEAREVWRDRKVLNIYGDYGLVPARAHKMTELLMGESVIEEAVVVDPGDEN